MQKMLNRIVCAGAIALCAGLSFVHVARGAEGFVVQRISGQVSYQGMAGRNGTPIIGQLLVQPRGYAVTQARSMAAIDLPDSSVVSVGASSRVGLGALDLIAGTSHEVMRIYDGAIHFSVRHPKGSHSNYVFITPVSQIAVRGTEGIIVARGDETIIACVHGSTNDIFVTYGAHQKMYVPDGMTVYIRGRVGGKATMSMRPGISGAEFGQFMPIVARNHAMRMRGLGR